jgi:hypothetical protein
MQKLLKVLIGVASMAVLQFSLMAQESVLPRPFEVYGGTIGVIDAIEIAAGKSRVFASTDSANSVFYADVDHSIPSPLGTNFIFTVLPDVDANANFGAPNWIAAHQQSGRLFIGSSSGLLSCTTSRGSLATNIASPIDYVLIQGSTLFAVSEAMDEMTPRTLYYGSLDSSGKLTLGSSLATNFYGHPVQLAVSPVNRKVYVICAFDTNCIVLKSLDDFDAFNATTAFSQIPTVGVTVPEIERGAVGPDGRLFLGGRSSSNTMQVAWSDNEGGSWTFADTGATMAGGGEGLNIVCNGVSNAYEVYYGWVVSTNKGAGTWVQLPRSGMHSPATHVNAGCIKVDPLNSNMIYLTTDKGVGGSTNAGASVVELNNGLLAFQINDIDALDSKTVAWIGSKAGMRRATDFNTASPVWTDGDFPDAIVYACTIDKSDSSGMTGYAGSCRLYRTTTGGGTNASAWTQVWRWEDYLSDGEIRSVKADGNFVALGYFSYAQSNPSGAVYVSSTAGTSWTPAITNVNVNDMLMRDEGGTGVIFVAVSKSMATERGGIYRIAASTVALDMTNEVNIRKIAEDSDGGLYASGTIPDVSNPGRHQVVVYYRTDSVSGWDQVTTNGLPGDQWEGEVLGRGLGPVITVGKDSASNDVPVLALVRTIYYLPYGGSSWVTVTNYPNGTQIKTLFYDELMVGTTIGLYGQGLNAVPADNGAAFVPLAADFDGDAKADPALFNTNGNWKIKLSTANYTMTPLTGFLGDSGATALAADFDGDRLADPAVYYAALELWAVKLSSINYAAPTVITSFGGSGWQAVAGDFDGDRLADPALYNTNGTWKVKLSTAGYASFTREALLGFAGWTAIAADFDGDGKADPTIYQASSGSWIVLLSKANYAFAILDPNFLGSTGYTGMAADFDADGYADPTVAEVSTGNWKIKLSSGNYSLLDLPGFLGE